MSLHVDRYAYAGRQRAPLLLIHGWGMHGGMWGDVAEQTGAAFPRDGGGFAGAWLQRQQRKGRGARDKVQGARFGFSLEP